MKKKSGIVDELTKGIDFLYKKNKVKKYIGTAKLITANSIEITGENTRDLIHAKNIIIATGSEATHLPNVNIDEKKIVTSTGALELKEVPKKMIVIGAGIIGLEMGTVWRLSLIHI